jgi:hypothetical protein
MKFRSALPISRLGYYQLEGEHYAASVYIRDAAEGVAVGVGVYELIRWCRYKRVAWAGNTSLAGFGTWKRQMCRLVQAQPRRNAAHGRLALLAVVCLVLAVRDRGRRRPPQDQLDKINNMTVNGMRRTS